MSKDLDSYISKDHADKNNFDKFGNLYADAMKEFLIPFPSTSLDMFPIFNKSTGGFRPREFSILCGSTGSGKTTLIANWSASLITQGISHFVASVETGHTDFIKRVISCLADENWNTGEVVPLEKLKKFQMQYGDMIRKAETYLSLYDNRFSVTELMSEIALAVKTKNIKIAFIDNLNFFMEVKAATETIQEMDRVIHELIIFCKRIDVHVVMVMHPKKTESGRVESEFDIKGSSTAVQESHNIFLFNRVKREWVDPLGDIEQSDREIKISKMRRRGMSIGKSIILKTSNGVRYFERGAYELT